MIENAFLCSCIRALNSISIYLHSFYRLYFAPFYNYCLQYWLCTSDNVFFFLLLPLLVLFSHFFFARFLLLLFNVIQMTSIQLICYYKVMFRIHRELRLFLFAMYSVFDIYACILLLLLAPFDLCISSVNEHVKMCMCTDQYGVKYGCDAWFASIHSSSVCITL